MPAADMASPGTGRVPHYDGAAVATGSLIFLVLLAVFVGIVFLKRRR